MKFIRPKLFGLRAEVTLVFPNHSVRFKGWVWQMTRFYNTASADQIAAYGGALK